MAEEAPKKPLDEAPEEFRVRYGSDSGYVFETTDVTGNYTVVFSRNAQNEKVLNREGERFPKECIHNIQDSIEKGELVTRRLDSGRMVYELFGATTLCPFNLLILRSVVDISYHPSPIITAYFTDHYMTDGIAAIEVIQDVRKRHRERAKGKRRGRRGR